MNRPSPTRATHVALALLVLSSGCGSNVQDLGYDPPPVPGEVQQPTAPGEGLGAEWASSPNSRDLACPLTRPIEGDLCPDRNTAPCTYWGMPEPAPGYGTLNDVERRSITFCMCMQSHVWRCVQGVTTRTLYRVPVAGAACSDSMEIERGDGSVCVCEHGTLRCGS